MPFGDGTGPRGMGPMTGRGMGFCGVSYNPGHFNMVPKFRLQSGYRSWTWHRSRTRGKSRVWRRQILLPT
jgi:hypothetical protein